MMDKTIKAKPAKYPNTSIGEGEAIAVLESIICYRNVKPDLKKMDKYPNIDGLLEITENDQTPIGKLEVQVRKLSDRALDNPKDQCDLSFLSYCEQALLPVLLIAVDTANTVAYWIHMSRDFLRTLEPKSGAGSVSVKIPKESIIKKGSLNYLPKWKEIIYDHYVKLSTYDDVKKEREALKLLLKKSEPTLGLKKKEFVEIHKFLDLLNADLDSSFRGIKRILFQDCWKVGIAYSHYTSGVVSYVLYPIPYSKNDVQIRKMSQSLRDELQQQGLTFITHYQENPIATRPKSFVVEIIRSRLRRIVESRLLPIRHTTLAREFIICFADRFHIPLGVDQKDEYGLEEIRFGFFRYLPVWIGESLKTKKISLGKQGFIDPGLFLCQMSDDEREVVAKRVKARLSKEEYNTIVMPLGNKEFPLGLLADLLEYLGSIRFSKIRRLYIPKNYRRAKGSFWSLFSPEDARRNVEIFFECLPQVYDSIVDDYFPELKSELHFFKDFDRLVVVIDVKDEYGGDWHEHPSIKCYYLRNTQRKEATINVYMKSDQSVPVDESVQFRSDIAIDGNTYELVLRSSGILDFIYHDLPMLEHVYDLLNERFDSYFKAVN